MNATNCLAGIALASWRVSLFNSSEAFGYTVGRCTEKNARKYIYRIREKQLLIFTRIKVENDDKGRLGVQKKEAAPADFVEHLKDNLSGFPLHRFNSKNQKKEYEELLKNVKPGQVVMTRDFAEKLQLKEPREQQSLHWDGILLTLYTCVSVFLVPDVERVGKFKKVKCYLGFFSDR